jgi:AraC-like DNA-binding protein
MLEISTSLVKICSVALLVLALFSFASQRLSEAKSKRFYLLSFFFALGVSGILSNALSIRNFGSIRVLFPQFSMAMFLLGPSLFLFSRPKRVSRIRIFFHYTPYVLFLTSASFYNYLNPIPSSVWVNLEKTIMPLSSIERITLLAEFPIHPILGLFSIVTYGSLSLKFNSNVELNVLTIGIILSLITLNLHYYGIVPNSLWFMNLMQIGANLLILIPGFKFLVFYNPIENELRRITAGELLFESQPIHPDLSKFLEDKEMCRTFFTGTQITIEKLIEFSHIDSTKWTNYFMSTNTSLVGLKQKIRVDCAKELVENGFLHAHSIDALAMEIGYRSRTSFYTAFLNQEEKSFTLFKKGLSSDSTSK